MSRASSSRTNFEYDFEEGSGSEYEYEECDDYSENGEKPYQYFDISDNMKDTADESHSLYNQAPVSCPICYEEKVEEGFALTLPGCFHSFCVRCFSRCIEIQCNQGNADGITCPFIVMTSPAPRGENAKDTVGQHCKTSVAMNVLREIMGMDSYEKLIQQKNSAFVRKNVDYHHCPTPDCTNIVYCRTVNKNDTQASGTVARVADCFLCGRTTCLECGVSPFHMKRTCGEYQQHINKRRKMEQMRQLQISAEHYYDQRRVSLDRSRANEDTRYEFEIEPSDDSKDSNFFKNNIKRCRRCGEGIELQDGCLKMKCLCGYRFCYNCGSENAQCNCTPAHHGFTDNRTGRGDFAGLRDKKSHT